MLVSARLNTVGLPNNVDEKWAKLDDIIIRITFMQK